MFDDDARLRIAPTPEASADPLAAWHDVMPRELLCHPRLTGDARIVAAYLWALALAKRDALVRLPMAAIEGDLSMASSTVRDAIGRLGREGFLTVERVRRGRPEYGGGTEIQVHGPAALAERMKVNRPADAAQRRLPLAAADERVAECEQLAREISSTLGGRNKPHTVEKWLIAAGAMLGSGIEIEVISRDRRRRINVTLSREDLRSVTQTAERRPDAGKAWYFLVRDRLSQAAGVDVRMPSRSAVRAAAERIGWRWRRSWEYSPRQLHSMYIAAREAGDDRDGQSWLAAFDREA